MRRFFYDSTFNQGSQGYVSHMPLASYELGQDVELPEAVLHHWCRVLRAKVGDTAALFDGFGGEYQVKLSHITKKQAHATLLSFDPTERTPDILTTIGLVMSRGDKMDYAIQKSTELGVSAIQLLTSQHGEVKLKPAQVPKKVAHWQHVAISACEQCGLNRPPLILPPIGIDEWLQHEASVNSANSTPKLDPVVKPLLSDAFYHQVFAPALLKLMLSVPDGQSNDLANTHQQIRKTVQSNATAQPQSTSNIHLLIGPEGGLNNDEQQLAIACGFKPWQIGARVLRTETAPVVALATLHTLCLH